MLADADAKKLKKEKKALKSLLKGLLIRNLSTKKSFLPLPVPIPGKWHQLITELHERREHAQLHRGAQLATSERAARGSNERAIGAAVALRVIEVAATRAAASAKTEERAGNSNAKRVVARLALELAKSNLNSRDGRQQVNVHSLKKLARSGAAKYATKLVMGKQQMNSVRATNPSSKSKLIFKAPFGPALVGSLAKGTFARVANKNPLVIAHNLAKLAKQLRELDAASLMRNQINKKSFNLIDKQKLIPYLQMNINNKKSLANKMNYIHSLTSDLNRRHRTSHVLL